MDSSLPVQLQVPRCETCSQLKAYQGGLQAGYLRPRPFNSDLDLGDAKCHAIHSFNVQSRSLTNSRQIHDNTALVNISRYL